MKIKTLEIRSTLTTNPVITKNTVETIHIQTENETTSIYICVYICSCIILMIDHIYSANVDIACDRMSYIKYGSPLFRSLTNY